MNTLKAVQRACELVELLGAGEVVDGVMDVIAKDSSPRHRQAGAGEGQRPAGHRRLPRRRWSASCEVPGLQRGGRHHPWSPPGASDVEHYSDIAEEVARFHGYNNIPDTLIQRSHHPPAALTAIQQTENLLGSVCRAAGYDEIITYSFISPTYYDKIRPAQGLPPAGFPEDPESPGRGYLHHAHHHPALHAGDPDPELQLPQQVRQAL